MDTFDLKRDRLAVALALALAGLPAPAFLAFIGLRRQAVVMLGEGPPCLLVSFLSRSRLDLTDGVHLLLHPLAGVSLLLKVRYVLRSDDVRLDVLEAGPGAICEDVRFDLLLAGAIRSKPTDIDSTVLRVHLLKTVIQGVERGRIKKQGRLVVLIRRFNVLLKGAVVLRRYLQVLNRGNVLAQVPHLCYVRQGARVIFLMRNGQLLASMLVLHFHGLLMKGGVGEFRTVHNYFKLSTTIILYLFTRSLYFYSIIHK